MSNDSKNNLSEFAKLASNTSVGTVVATAAALLGADLVVVALAWDNPPNEGGIVTITFLMLISFVAFINVLHHIMRSDLLVARLRMKEVDEKVKEKDSIEFSHILKSVRFMHVMGLLFTMIAFWIISYKYLLETPHGYHLVILLLPFILFLLYWVPTIVGVEREVSFRSRESLIQLFIQIIFLVLICLDFFRILTIP